MRRKRLQHQADIFCHMFCGWRLMNDHQTITQQGSGRIIIDLLSENSTYNNKIIPLNMTCELITWFNEDLQAHNIDKSFIKKALLTVDLEVGDLKGDRKAPERWNSKIRDFIFCKITSNSFIETDEKIYESSYQDYEEWPNGWWNEKK
jgi:hypothetical protein